MFKKGLAVLVMALFSASLFADIELSTSIADVQHDGTNELAGSVTMRVNDDDFSNASTLEPVFIRVTLSHQSVLADTLVNLNGSGDRTDAEIYLAMNLENRAGYSLTASPETVSIVRWVEGESALWIRVQSASSAWTNDGVSDLPPSAEVKVSWTFGISARSSYERGLNIPVVRRNLPFNTRDSAVPNDEVSYDVDDAVSTLICVDLSDGILDPRHISDLNSVLRFDPIAFDETAEVVEGSYRTGVDTGINFTNDFEIARGFDRSCTVTWEAPEKSSAPAVQLCVQRNGNADPDGWVSDWNTIIFDISCDDRLGAFDAQLYPGAYIRFTSVDANSGFRSTGDVDAANSYGRLWTSNTLNSSIDLVYNGAAQSLMNRSVEWSAAVRVWRWYTNDEVDDEGKIDVVLNWEVWMVNHEGAEEDETPVTHGAFNSSNRDHNRFCDQSEYMVGEGSWDWGTFVLCTGEDSVLFFPYLPQVVGNDSFWAGLAVVNHGGIDLDSVVATVYGEDGSRHTVNLNPLAQNAQETWLLTTDDNGAAVFKGYSGSNNDQEAGPSGADGDADAELFGTTRSSMFIVGDFVTSFDDETDLGDLDGYLLVGKGGDIDGSYLPRNVEPMLGARHQTGDLPPMKRQVAPQVTENTTRPATHPSR